MTYSSCNLASSVAHSLSEKGGELCRKGAHTRYFSSDEKEHLEAIDRKYTSPSEENCIENFREGVNLLAEYAVRFEVVL